MNLSARDVLCEFVRTKLSSHRLIVVSNREPFQHKRVRGRIECTQPASGMASALDHVARACGGLWVAHGSGNADKQTVDRFSRVAVPPGRPEYTLRRVWLSKEEEEGHYGGLSNQGLWPLCHMSFTRPVFDADHWRMYRRVNQRFADAVLAEAGSDPAVVFIQDYHFALLPRMLRNANPNLVIAQFWHIPWPNREVFRIFPWQEEMLDGLLGNDLLGFHLPEHCQNFTESARSIETGFDEEGGAVVCRGGHSTSVQPFPIGIDVEEHVAVAQSEAVASYEGKWRKRLSLDGKLLGIGIDRLDYTKGIPERLRFLDRFLETHREHRGKLVYLQVAVPSRSTLPAYRQIAEEIERLTTRINKRWQTLFWKPIVLLKQHFTLPEMIALHRLASFCVVSSLHDGMNLVAKEFVASRADEDGVLILSKFAGADRELKDALHINPFSIEEGARAYESALQMPREERRRRMRKLRQAVEENDVYRWALDFLSELAFTGLLERNGQEQLEYDAVGLAV
ncbi:MAG TPA: trehalose-6-phosphate synthase [Bryobacteraceae bacterium]|nr:trehalose-6-phosphate synthase [Bryobacteraceae bacterium]